MTFLNGGVNHTDISQICKPSAYPYRTAPTVIAAGMPPHAPTFVFI
ncbi:hypothetical protein NEICINOT_03963 [Neisseria cinerea ATCC 14685]|uniref:Uncharacterized protein n=1 Tax=Neisseria cinerea ATCC 14685 TaxID=546262 RepID=D0W2S9_NEICI|nr:hypothetical protein NEICINOT_03963 [Neisseria cinerea ATCC 14685]